MHRTVYFWNSAPVFRLLVPLIAGTVLQRECQIPFVILVVCLGVCICFVCAYSFTPVAVKFRLRIVAGMTISLLMTSVGCALIWLHDVRNSSQWFGHHYHRGAIALVWIEEPLVEKQNSFKAVASVTGIYHQQKIVTTKGKAILYFKKDSVAQRLKYGTVLLISNLQKIKNAGNPGGFDYLQYCLASGISHQAYLTPESYLPVAGNGGNAFHQFIFNSRNWILTTLRKYVRGEKELGLAEALLIGYRDDLDKTLVQAYSNTGVVHVIAISGLHLGLIYALLLLVTKPMKKLSMQWVRIIVICMALWLFSILAGAQASVVRSAVMFSFVAVGELISKKATVLNTLSLSAFLLLCYNPYWLWDPGFQLSYSAVLSIVVFFRPVYNWLVVENRLLDLVWKLSAVTLSAQVLTLPISVFHFHQLPVFFLFTNLVAVPMGSAILIGEIILMACTFLEPVAQWLGRIIEFLIFCMNSYIERWDAVPFSILDWLQISTIQLCFLFVFITGVVYWMLEKRKTGLWIGLVAFLAFSVLRAVSFTNANDQKKIIVYNVPKHRAIDIMDGRRFCFLGDPILAGWNPLNSLHLRPSRVQHRVTNDTSVVVDKREFVFHGKRVLIVDTTIIFLTRTEPVHLDLLILSKNPRLYIGQLTWTFKISQVVIDGSVPRWKAALWQRDCDSLSIPCHDVSVKGAFVMNVR